MLNRVILRGYVADDPFIRATEKGKMAQLRLATIERITERKSGEIREITEWHSITMWLDLAERADREIRIGAAIEVEGALRTRDWEDKKGKMHRTTQIVASSLRIIEEGLPGYALPRAIAERREVLYPTKKGQAISEYEIKAPESDPDGLPF